MIAARTRATAATVLAATLLLAPTMLGGTAGAADELSITSATAEEGVVTIECTLPAGVVDTIDLASAVTVLENGTAIVGPQVAKVPSAGLEVVLLLDISGSMREGNAIGAARQAAGAFLDALPRDVAVGVVAFNDVVSLTAPLGVDRAATLAAIGALAADGETALYDAMVFAPQLFSGATADRQIVLLSDGGDTVSRNTVDAALRVAAGIRTSVIELTSSEANAAVLQQLATAAGGQRASVSDPAALAGLYGDIADDLLNRFRVQFAPTVSGSATYTVQVATGRATLEATTTLTVTVPATVVPTTTADAGATAPSSPTATTVPLTGSTGGDRDGGLSAGTLRTLGAVSIFAAVVILLLVIADPTRTRRAAVDLRTMHHRASGDAKKGLGSAATNLAERAMAHAESTKTLSRALDVAGIPLRTGEFVVLTALGGGVYTLLLAAILPAWLGVLVGVATTPLIARLVVRSRMDLRRRQFVEQLPDLLQNLVSSLRAGYGLPQSLDVAAAQASEPTRGELRRVLFEVRIGRDPGDALADAADRMASQDFTWVVSAMQINREVGGELAVVLENIGETVRERQRLRRQIRVLTAEGRMSAYILTALPVVLVGALLLSNRDYFEPFSRSPGPFLVVLAVLLLAAGWAWIRQLVKAEG